MSLVFTALLMAMFPSLEDTFVYLDLLDNFLSVTDFVFYFDSSYLHRGNKNILNNI